MQISEDPDCEKALSALALTAVCNYYTGGNCPPCCSKAAAIVGPILAKGVQAGLDVLESLWDGIAGSFQDLLGFGDDGPTWTENMNAMMWRGYDILKVPMSASIDAIVKSDVESKRSFGAGIVGVPGVPGPKLPSNMPGSGSTNPSSQSWATKLQEDRRQVYGIIDAVEHLAEQTMTESLRGQSGFGFLKVMCVPSANGAVCRFVEPGQKILGVPVESISEATFVSAPGMPSGWSISNQDGWAPNGFVADYATANVDWAEQYLMVQTAYGLILTERTRAIKNAAMEAVGKTIARNVQEAGYEDYMRAEMKIKPPKSNTGFFWAAAVLLAGAGGVYWYKRKSAKS